MKPTLGTAALIALLRLYRVNVSPLLPRACRFHPSCSQFAQEAVAAHGARIGILMAVGRLCRCHPWHPGGYDPVPARKA